MSDLNFVDSEDVFLFVFDIKNTKKPDVAAIDFLSSRFPFELKKEQIIICRNRNSKSYLCFVSRNGFEQKKISSVLYVMNHYGIFTGIAAVKRTNGDTEYISIKNGAVEWCRKVIEPVQSVSRYVSESEIRSSYKDRDLLYKRSFNDYLRIYSPVIYGLTFVFIALFAVILFFNIRTENYKRQAKASNDLNQQKIEQSKIQKKKIAEFKKELDGLQETKYGNCYSRISLLYDCLGNDVEIRNLNLDRNFFSIDVLAKDAVKILARFEKHSRLLKDVKMNRSTSINERENISFSGQFVSVNVVPEFKNLDEEFNYYRARVESEKEILKKNSERKVSEYTALVRKYFDKYDFNEQFIQFSTQNDVFVLECYVLASSSGLLNFLKSIQNEQIVIIQKLNINCTSAVQSLRSVIYFYTGIMKNNTVDEEIQDVLGDASVTEISRVFKVTKQQPKTVRKENVKVVKTVEKPALAKAEISKPAKYLTYVGQTKKSGQIIMVLKDEEMGVLYNLPLVDSSMSGNYCILNTNGSYYAYIRNICYGVKK